MPRHLLIVDDDPTVRASLADALEHRALRVSTAADGTAALAELAAGPVDLVLTDVRMPDLNGVELLKLIRERSPSLDVVLMTAYDEIPAVVAAMREGARDFLVKPLDLQELRSLVDRILSERSRRTGPTGGAAADPSLDPAEYRLDRLVGRDPHMIEAFKIVGQAARNRVNVLIRGESGTGKELIARARDRGFLSGLTGLWALPIARSPWCPGEAGPASALSGRKRGHEARSLGGAPRATPRSSPTSLSEAWAA